MSRLSELIAELCPEGVEFRNLEDCCSILDSKRKPVTKGNRESGEYPYYGANGIQDYVADYIFDGTFVLVGEDGSVITEAGTPVVTWAEGKIWVNNHAHIIEEDRDVLLRYLYHCLQTIRVDDLIHGNIPKLNQGDFRKLQIPVPPLEVQREIVHVLDNFTLLSAGLSESLSAELSARRKQYEYYRNSMLSLNIDSQEVLLSDIVVGIFSGKNKERLEESQYPVYGSTGIIAKTNTPVYNHEQILVARVGANAGYVHLADGQYDVSDNTLILDVKRDCVLKYIYYVLVNMNLNRYAKGGGQPLITASQLKKLSISLPQYEMQQKIVSVLDNFAAICSDLSSDLLAEIEACSKQYEHYRDKLLTFKELRS